MVMAELGGKISRSGANISDRSEDLLTSDVFGALRFSVRLSASQTVNASSLVKEKGSGKHFFGID